VVPGIQEALQAVKDQEKAYVIGGGEIYRQFMPFVDKIELTRVHGTFDADTYFPEINSDEWKMVFQEFHPKDENHNYDFTFQTYVRNKKA